jgi:hypothetical protein
MRQHYGSPYSADRHVWRCRPCDASVGCHGHSKTPLGTLAKAALRKARHSAHGVFDPLWKTGHYTRRQAYQLLADEMNIPFADCHIANFNEDQCVLVTAFAARHRAAIFQNAVTRNLPHA